MRKRNLFVVSRSDRPLGLYKTMVPESLPQLIPTVPLEYVQNKLGQLIGENPVHQKALRTGNVVGYIQDATAAIDIIAHSMFLYVETPLNFRQFLREYADIPDQCPVCEEEIEFLDPDERLAHIIKCKWVITRTSSPAASIIVEPDQLTMH